MIPDVDDVMRINQICANKHFSGDVYALKLIIRTAFPRNRNERMMYRKVKPQAFLLRKAIEVLEVYLATQELDEMITWANRG